MPNNQKTTTSCGKGETNLGQYICIGEYIKEKNRIMARPKLPGEQMESDTKPENVGGCADCPARRAVTQA